MTRGTCFRTAASVPTLLLSALVVLPAQDWPQWRGPNRDGVVASFKEPAEWPARLERKWQIAVGTGHSSPVLVNDRIYLHTRQGEEEVVACYEFTTGRQIWRDAYPAPYTMSRAATSHGKGPKSTPVFGAGRLCTLGIGGILSCYDAVSGKLRWRKQPETGDSNASPLYGAATSPIIDGGRLITHLGGDRSGALTAFELETGRIVWNWNGDGPGYSSPVVVTLEGTRQLVTQSKEYLVGISVADGKLLWSVPFTTPYSQNIITPIVFGDTLIFSGLENGVMAIRASQSGGKWTTRKVWEEPEDSFYMSTPVLNGGLLFGMSNRNRGRFVALDARTGKRLWAAEGRAGESAAVVTHRDKLFLLTNDAELLVARASGAGFEQLRKYTVARSATWAHPVVTGSGILVKDVDTLAFWGFE